MERIEPGPNQESVWDYPRPPKLTPSTRHVRVRLNGQLIAETNRAYRVLETSHPPTWYIPPQDVKIKLLSKTSKISFCEWKGSATYWTVTVQGRQTLNRVWSYENPASGFAPIRDHFAFYPSSFECLVDDKQVQAQAGDFYGGWITQDVVGPFKGAPGTWGW